MTTTQQVQSSFIRLFGKDITIQSKPCPSSSTLGSSTSTLTLLDHATVSHPEPHLIKIFGAMINLKDTQSRQTSSHRNGDQIFSGQEKWVLSVDDSHEFRKKGTSQLVASSTSSTMGGKGFHLASADHSQRHRKRKGMSQLVDNMVASTSSRMEDQVFQADSQRCRKRRRRILAPPLPVAVAVPGVQDREGMNHDRRFNIRKELTTSDVNANARLILHRNLVEPFVLPTLNYQDKLDLEDSKKGLIVSINDLDTHSRHTLKFKLQFSSNCYILISNWRETFVRRRSLCKGDEIGMAWNNNDLSFDFTVLRRATPWALVLYSSAS